MDGINESLVEANPIEEMEEDTVVSLKFDKEKLYKNMVDAKADWLYELPQWDKIFDKEKKHELYLEQKKSGTIVKGPKIGRNDPCPCGSGKKYKTVLRKETRLMKVDQKKAGVLLSYLAQIIHILSGILYTPIMLRLLGQSEYGLYQLVASVVSYLNVLSLGFGSSYMRFYSRIKKDGDE
mgnify:CR=1 FL=1